MNAESTHRQDQGETDESAPLLQDEEHGPGPASPGARHSTPLPRAQLGALISARIVDPIAYVQIFPYINQLLVDLHISEPEQVGFYSGFIESAYSLAQTISVYQWGRLSDVIGRRPVVMFTVTGIAVTTVAFGWSTSLATILASRFLGGLVAGNIAVLHSILVEITDDTNQNIAVPIYSLSWSTGSIIGSLIGGTFANAATRYPKYFSWPIFVHHPYLPPCIISSICALLGLGMVYLLVEETLPSKRKDNPNGVLGRKSASSPDTNTESAETGYASMKALLSIPALRALTLSGLAISFLASSFDVVFALFCYAPITAGGLGLQPSTIGNFLAFAGSFAVLLRLVAMPYILCRFDHAATYNACTSLWPITFAFFPLLNALACSSVHSDMSPGTDIWNDTATTMAHDASIWIGLAFVLTLSKIAAIPFSITMLLTKRYAPTSPTPTMFSSSCVRTSSGTSHSTSASGSGSAAKTSTGSALGRSNGLVQFAMCLGRTVGPVVVSSLFTALNGSTWARQWGVSWMWSGVMVCFSLAGIRLAKSIQ